MDTVVLYVGEKQFVTDIKTLSRFPDTVLGKLKPGVYHYDDRPSHLFESILEYYQTGDLKKPKDVYLRDWYYELYVWRIIEYKQYIDTDYRMDDILCDQHILYWECIIV